MSSLINILRVSEKRYHNSWVIVVVNLNKIFMPSQLFSTVTFVMMMATSCQDNGFRGDGGRVLDIDLDFSDATAQTNVTPQNNVDDIDDPEIKAGEKIDWKESAANSDEKETFIVASKLLENYQGNVEMLWILDNSASIMRQHASSIKNGFSDFLASLTSGTTKTYLRKMAIASCTGGFNSNKTICLDKLTYRFDKHRIQVIPTLIHSVTALYTAINLLCKKKTLSECRQSAGVADEEWDRECDDTNSCDKRGPNPLTWESFWQFQINAGFVSSHGTLANFFSDDSTKIVVVVSDDTSFITADEFLTFWQANYSEKDSFTFYAFIENESEIYPQLATNTNGNTFSIDSSTSWSKKFNSLASHISESATGESLKLKTEFKFAKKAKAITSLTIDDKVFHKKDMAIIGQTSRGFKISPTYVQEGSKIVITYTTK
ncbi:MAG: hypothetical protein OXC40_07630 [Proteobacteria bacterium]|nr:hypothetical protein [Pseudomonadota bacterium]